MTERNELLLKLALCLLSLAALAWRVRGSRRGGPGPRRAAVGDTADRAGPLLTLLAIAAVVAALTNFFSFHNGELIHFQEMFHYQLGAKYFPELGYDGLYAASVAAQVEAEPDLPRPGTIRDLKTNEIVPAADAVAQRAETIARFSPDRWKSFVADHRYFARAVAVSFPDTRIDHGYNPTPAWTFVGRLFNAWLPLGPTTVPMLALLDWALIGAALVAVHRTYGAAAAATFAILLGFAYPWRYVWVGGSFLRYDWLAAVVIGVCLMKRSRFAAAGALFAYATAVRIFPVLLLAGVGVVAVRELHRRAGARWIARFAAGFLAALAACAVAGALAGRGPGAWVEFAKNIKKHNETWSLNTVGLELGFVYPPAAMLGRPSGWPLAHDENYTATLTSSAEGGFVVEVPALGVREKSETLEGARILAEEAIARRGVRWQEEMVQVQKARRPLFLGVAALFVVLVLLAAWRRSAHEAAILGVATVFALLHLSSYYWVVLALIALRRDRIGALGSLGLVALNAATFAVALITPVLQVIYLDFTWGLAILLAAWLVPDALATIRREPALAPEPPGGPPAPPSKKRASMARVRR